MGVQGVEACMNACAFFEEHTTAGEHTMLHRTHGMHLVRVRVRVRVRVGFEFGLGFGLGFEFGFGFR